MDKANIAAEEPMVVAVVPEKIYSWCTCGLSEKQPFCDGRHKTIEGMPFRSLKVQFHDPGRCLLLHVQTNQDPAIL